MPEQITSLHHDKITQKQNNHVFAEINKGKNPSILYESQKRKRKMVSLSHVSNVKGDEQQKINILKMLQKNKEQLIKSQSQKRFQRRSRITEYSRNENSLETKQNLQKKLSKYKKKQIKEQTLKRRTSLPKIQRSMYLIKWKSQCSFNLKQHNSICLDSIFPMHRYGSAMTSNDKSLFLIGGYQTNNVENWASHEFDSTEDRWKAMKLKNEDSKPMRMPCFHTVQNFKNHLIILGGVVYDNIHHRKVFNSEIIGINLQKSQCFKVRGSITLKNHASTLFNNTIMIHGGIDSHSINSNYITFINFNSNGQVNIQMPMILQIENKGCQDYALSHHQLVNTFEIESHLKSLMKYDGVFCFGGINNNLEMHNCLSFYGCFSKNGQLLDQKNKKWESIEVIGEKPCPRKCHTLNILNKKGVILLIGGVDEESHALNDIWLFDLFNLSWSSISTNPSIGGSINQLLNHTTSFIASRLFIFNGALKKNKEKILWSIQTEENKITTKKNKLSRENSRKVTRQFVSSISMSDFHLL